MTKKVLIPQVNIWDVGGGVQKIIEATYRNTDSEEPLILDFSFCSFLSAEATALLASIFLDRQKSGFQTQIDPFSVQAEVRRYLNRVGFFSICGLEEGYTYPASSLPLFTTEALEKDQVLRYIDREIMGRHEMPTMTEPLSKEIRRAFFEVIGNVFHHSESPVGAIVCGQIYPNANKIQITFLDRGVGLAAKVRSCVSSIRDDGEAIQWALKRGTSTLASRTQSRGLGLYLLREFIRANEGEFRIYANGAFLEETQGNANPGLMDPPLRGTLVDLRINIRPDVRYGFQEDFEN